MPTPIIGSFGAEGDWASQALPNNTSPAAAIERDVLRQGGRTIRQCLCRPVYGPFLATSGSLLDMGTGRVIRCPAFQQPGVNGLPVVILDALPHGACESSLIENPTPTAQDRHAHRMDKVRRQNVALSTQPCACPPGKILQFLQCI